MIKDVANLIFFLFKEKIFNIKILITIALILIFSALMEIFTIFLVAGCLAWLVNPTKSLSSFLLIPENFIISDQKLSILLLLILFLNFLFQQLNLFVINNVTSRVGVSLSSIFFNSLINPNGLIKDEYDHDDIYRSIMIETQRVAVGLLNPLITGVSKVFFLMFAIIGLFILNPSNAMSAVAIVSIIYFLIFIFLKPYLSKLGIRVTSFQAIRSNQLARLFGNIKTFKIYGNYHDESLFFKKNSEKYYNSFVNINLLSNSPRFFLELLIFGALVSLIILTLKGAFEITPNLIASFSIYFIGIIKIFPAAQVIYATIGVMQGNISALYTLQSFYDFNNLDNVKKVNSSKEIKNLTKLSFRKKIKIFIKDYKSSDGKKYILRNIRLDIDKGDRCVFIGPSGSGKTSLVEIIGGLRNDFKGEISLDDKIITQQDTKKLREIVSYLDQNNSIFSGTLVENIVYSFVNDNPIDFKRLDFAIKYANLEDVIKELPDGIYTNLSDGGKELSGGQRQRIALARALYKDSDLIILDEVTSALDKKSEDKIIEALNNLPSNITLLIISHRPGPLRIANKTFEIKDGRII